MQANRRVHQPVCLLAHDLINKLSAIIGLCDLLIGTAERQDTECAKYLTSIHELAKSATKELIDHPCQLSLIIRGSKLQESVLH
jgi:light-regulated signal transduction histidine kinase (bacteriophytochrome)